MVDTVLPTLFIRVYLNSVERIEIKVTVPIYNLFTVPLLTETIEITFHTGYTCPVTLRTLYI